MRPQDVDVLRRAVRAHAEQHWPVEHCRNTTPPPADTTQRATPCQYTITKHRAEHGCAHAVGDWHEHTRAQGGDGETRQQRVQIRDEAKTSTYISTATRLQAQESCCVTTSGVAMSVVPLKVVRLFTTRTHQHWIGGGDSERHQTTRDRHSIQLTQPVAATSTTHTTRSCPTNTHETVPRATQKSATARLRANAQRQEAVAAQQHASTWGGHRELLHFPHVPTNTTRNRRDTQLATSAHTCPGRRQRRRY